MEPKPHLHTEPGYYADGRFGVRIENVVIVKEVKTLNNFGAKGYLGFEHLTLVSPMSTLDETDTTMQPCSALYRRLSSNLICSQFRNGHG
jgi:hypothetical protein